MSNISQSLAQFIAAASQRRYEEDIIELAKQCQRDGEARLLKQPGRNETIPAVVARSAKHEDTGPRIVPFHGIGHRLTGGRH